MRSTQRAELQDAGTVPFVPLDIASSLFGSPVLFQDTIWKQTAFQLINIINTSKSDRNADLIVRKSRRELPWSINRKISLLKNKVHVELRNKLVRCFFCTWSHGLGPQRCHHLLSRFVLAPSVTSVTSIGCIVLRRWLLLPNASTFSRSIVLPRIQILLKIKIKNLICGLQLPREPNRSTRRLQIAVRRDNVISITLRQV